MSIAQNVTIAVFDFENNGGLEPSEVKILSARLQSEMVKAGGYKVVERKKIEKIFESKTPFNDIFPMPDFKTIPNENGELPKLEQMKKKNNLRAMFFLG